MVCDFAEVWSLNFFHQWCLCKCSHCRWVPFVGCLNVSWSPKLSTSKDCYCTSVPNPSLCGKVESSAVVKCLGWKLTSFTWREDFLPASGLMQVGYYPSGTYYNRGVLQGISDKYISAWNLIIWERKWVSIAKAFPHSQVNKEGTLICGREGGSLSFFFFKGHCL